VDFSQLRALFARAGAKLLYAKELAENDNSKNQVYFGPSFAALNLFPNQGVLAESGSAKPIFKAKIPFAWLLESGATAPAPHAQLILYPQYPEVRFSGFLRGAESPPSALMASRDPGRVLFMAVTSSDQVLGYVANRESLIGAEFRALELPTTAGVFVELNLPDTPTEAQSRLTLISELGRIHRLGWIDSKQLDSGGGLRSCEAPQCGGFTLEAELGISKNSSAEPDFLGWEIKQYSASAITLMTPEPNAGFYKDEGVKAFIRKYGYADRNNRPDRLNFGGVHRSGLRHERTHLTLTVEGYDAIRGRITDAEGSVSLVDDAGAVAAAWTLSGLLSHWSKKHSRAAYVPSLRRTDPVWQYSYSRFVRLAERTDSLRLLGAFAAGTVYYDPGIKLESASTPQATAKRRSQFRISPKDIPGLYESVEIVDVF